MAPPMPIVAAFFVASFVLGTSWVSPSATPAAPSNATRRTASPFADSQPKKAAPHLMPPNRECWTSTASRAAPRVECAPSVVVAVPSSEVPCVAMGMPFRAGRTTDSDLSRPLYGVNRRAPQTEGLGVASRRRAGPAGFAQHHLQPLEQVLQRLLELRRRLVQGQQRLELHDERVLRDVGVGLDGALG